MRLVVDVCQLELMVVVLNNQLYWELLVQRMGKDYCFLVVLLVHLQLVLKLHMVVQ